MKTSLILIAVLWMTKVPIDRMVILPSEDGAELTVSGAWSRDAGTSPEVPAVNGVRIECSRARQTCREYISRLVQGAATAGTQGHQNRIYTSMTTFRVVRWSEEVIVATARPGAADLKLTISLAWPPSVLRESISGIAKSKSEGSQSRWRLR